MPALATGFHCSSTFTAHLPPLSGDIVFMGTLGFYPHELPGLPRASYQHHLLDVLFLPAQQSWPSLGRCFLLLTAFTVCSLTLLITSLNCQGMDGVGLAVLSFLHLLFTVGVLRGILTPSPSSALTRNQWSSLLCCCRPRPTPPSRAPMCFLNSDYFPSDSVLWLLPLR